MRTPLPWLEAPENSSATSSLRSVVQFQSVEGAAGVTEAGAIAVATVGGRADETVFPIEDQSAIGA